LDISDSIADLQKSYTKATSSTDKDRLYNDLLTKLDAAQKRIDELEREKKSSKMPSKDEVEAMSGMLDLINKIDTSTIEKLNKLGGGR